jgi:uncharacterized protein
MTISMSNASLAVCTRMLQNLSHVLAKGEAHAKARNFEPQVLLQARLAPDMFALIRQVQIACDTSKNGLARLAGMEAPKFEDNETSFEQLQQRIAKTLQFIASVPASAIDGSEEKEFTFPVGPVKKRTMKGLPYLTQWMLPNLYFHITAAYAILRHNGVEVGKLDYLLGADHTL